MIPVAIGDTQGTLQARKTWFAVYKRPETFLRLHIFDSPVAAVNGAGSLGGTRRHDGLLWLWCKFPDVFLVFWSSCQCRLTDTHIVQFYSEFQLLLFDLESFLLCFVPCTTTFIINIHSRQCVFFLFLVILSEIEYSSALWLQNMIDRSYYDHDGCERHRYFPS